MLLGFFKKVNGCVSDYPRVVYFWRIRHTGAALKVKNPRNLGNKWSHSRVDIVSDSWSKVCAFEYHWDRFMPFLHLFYFFLFSYFCVWFGNCSWGSRNNLSITQGRGKVSVHSILLDSSCGITPAMLMFGNCFNEIKKLHSMKLDIGFTCFFGDVSLRWLVWETITSCLHYICIIVWTWCKC